MSRSLEVQIFLLDLLVKAQQHVITLLSGFSVLFLVALFSGHFYDTCDIPLVNGRKWYELTNTRSKMEFIGTYQLERLRKHFPYPSKGKIQKPFRIVSSVSEVTVLPPEMAPEILSHKNLDFHKAAKIMYFADIPGMQGFGFEGSEIMKLVIKRQFTHQLSLLTKPMSEECAAALRDIWDSSDEWLEFPVRDTMLLTMSRITSRVFLGDDLCRNPDWLRITTEYPKMCFHAVEELRLWPRFLVKYVHWYLPSCKAARELTRQAQVYIEDIYQSRKAMKNREKRSYNDAIEFMERTAEQDGIVYTHELRVNAQLCLSVAPVLSTTDLLTQTLLNIVSHPEIIDPMRAEIASVLGQDSGDLMVTNQALNNLKLMDSVLKESLRLKPSNITTLRRVTTATIRLSNGVAIPKNKMIAVPMHRHFDAEVYQDPMKWDPYRFYHMRQQPGRQIEALLTSATPSHLGFGLGNEACPGRFFAAATSKIVLCHLLMNYDLRLVPGQNIQTRKGGWSSTANPTAKLGMKKTKVDLIIV